VYRPSVASSGLLEPTLLPKMRRYSQSVRCRSGNIVHSHLRAARADGTARSAAPVCSSHGFPLLAEIVAPSPALLSDLTPRCDRKRRRTCALRCPRLSAGERALHLSAVTFESCRRLSVPIPRAALCLAPHASNQSTPQPRSIASLKRSRRA
jgi:hypothetical protein